MRFAAKKLTTVLRGPSLFRVSSIVSSLARQAPSERGLPRGFHRSSSFSSCSETDDIRPAIRTVLAHHGFSDKPFENTVVVGVQHMLDSTAQMFDVMAELGLKHAVLGGKAYSDHQPTRNAIEAIEGFQLVEAELPIGYGRFGRVMDGVAKEVWEQYSDMVEERNLTDYRLAIVDDGGHLMRAAPHKLFNGWKHKPKSVLGIEQTTNGFLDAETGGLPFPIINVAGSRVKRDEYRHVARIIARNLLEDGRLDGYDISRDGLKVGIVGYGKMGRAILNELSERGVQCSYYDSDPRAAMPATNGEATSACNSLTQLLYGAPDVLVTCVGKNVFDGEAIAYLEQSSSIPRVILNAGSADLDLLNLLHYVQRQGVKGGVTPDVFDDIVFKNSVGRELIIAKGGFPFNFDGSAHSVPPRNIFPTRALLAGSVACGELLSDDVYSRAGIWQVPTFLQRKIAEVADLPDISSLTNREISATSEGADDPPHTDGLVVDARSDLSGVRASVALPSGVALFPGSREKVPFDASELTQYGVAPCERIDP